MSRQNPTPPPPEPESSTWWQARSGFFKKTTLLLAILIFGTVLWTTVRLGLNHQSEKLLEMALAYQASGRNDDAKLALETASRLVQSNGSVDFLGRLGRNCASIGLSQEARVVYRMLLRKRNLDFITGQEMLALSIRLKEPVTTRHIYNFLQVRAGSDFLPLLFLAEARVSLGDDDTALEDLKKAGRPDSNTGLVVGIREQTQKKALPFANAANVRDTLESLSRKFGDRSAFPIYLGLKKACVPFESQPEYALRLKQHPACDMEMRLFANAILLRRKPASKQAIMAEILEGCRHATIQDRILAANWLMKEQEPDLAASLITDKEAVLASQAFPIWFDAHAETKQVEKLQSALQAVQNKMPESMWLFRSSLVMELAGQKEEAEAERFSALKNAKKNQTLLNQLAIQSAMAGDKETLAGCLKEAAKNKAHASEMLRAIISAVRESRNLRRLADVLLVAASNPTLSSDPAIRSELEYSNILLARKVDRDELKKLAKNNRASPECLFSYLAGLVASGNAEEALAELKKAKPDLDARSLASWQQAILVWIFTKNARNEEALEFAALIPPQALSFQEQAVLDRFLVTANKQRLQP
jgi:hypothetical protein